LKVNVSFTLLASHFSVRVHVPFDVRSSGFAVVVRWWTSRMTYVASGFSRTRTSNAEPETQKAEPNVNTNGEARR